MNISKNESMIPTSITKKRKLIELQRLNDDQLSSSDEETESDPDLPLHDTKLIKKPVQHDKKEEISILDQYKLAKAQLKYIKRENEMLCDEWATTEKKLKRLKVERRVLLDALVKRGYNDE